MPNNFDAFIPEVWSTLLIEKLRQKNLAMALVANTDYEGEIRQHGDTVHVRTVGRITTQSYTRGLDINYEALTPTKESMAINDAKYFAFEVDDLDTKQSDIGIEEAYAREAVVTFNELIDTKVFSYVTDAHADNRITNGGSAIDVSSVTSGTAVYELLVQAALKLNSQNVSSEGRWAILTPYVQSLLSLDTKYLIRATEMGDSVVASASPGMTAMTTPNYIGKLGGFDLYWSNNLPKNGSNHYMPFGQGRPISYASQINQVERLRLERTFATAVRGLMLHDGKVFAEPSKRLGYIYVDNS